MKLSLWTNHFVDRDQQQGQQIRATIERPYGREPVAARSCTSLARPSRSHPLVGWRMAVEDAIGETTASYLHEAGFR